MFTIIKFEEWLTSLKETEAIDHTIDVKTLTAEQFEEAYPEVN